MTPGGPLPNRMADNAAPDVGRVEKFFAAVRAAFARAAMQMGGTRTFAFALGTQHVRLDFAGSALIEPLTRALAHLAVHTQPHADITIQLWEIAETGVALPPPPWTEAAYRQRGEIAGYCDASHHTIYHADGRVLYLYDAAQRQGIVAVFDATLLPAYERAAALRPILFHALAEFEIQYTHAAAVGLPHAGVVLAGKGGTGKSTTALACLNSELLYVGDDYCGLYAPTDGAQDARAYSLYNSAKATAETLARLAFLEPMIQFWDIGGSEKAIWFMHERMSHKIIKSVPVRAILIPRVTGKRDTQFSPASFQAALRALMPSTITQLPNADERTVRRLLALVKRIPAYHLELGTDMPQIPQTILTILKSFGARA